MVAVRGQELSSFCRGHATSRICASIWNPYMQKNCDMLEKVQHRAARWIGPSLTERFVRNFTGLQRRRFHIILLPSIATKYFIILYI